MVLLKTVFWLLGLSGAIYAGVDFSIQWGSGKPASGFVWLFALLGCAGTAVGAVKEIIALQLTDD